jgi:hypothetical protein
MDNPVRFRQETLTLIELFDWQFISLRGMDMTSILAWRDIKECYSKPFWGVLNTFAAFTT